MGRIDLVLTEGMRARPKITEYLEILLKRAINCVVMVSWYSFVMLLSSVVIPCFLVTDVILLGHRAWRSGVTRS